MSKSPYSLNFSWRQIKIPAIYLLFGVLWIVFSDSFLKQFLPAINQLAYFQTFKGIGFVIITAVLLFFLINRHFHTLEASLTTLEASLTTLELTRNRLVTLFGNLPGMVYSCKNTKTWEMLFVSQHCIELTGYNPDDLLHNNNLSYLDLIHPDDRAKTWNSVQNSIQRNQPYELIYRITTADGIEKWVWEKGVAVPPEHLTPSEDEFLLEGFITDITDEVKAHEKIRFQSLLLDNVNESVIAADLQGKIIWWGGGAETLYGYTVNEALGQRFQQLFFPPNAVNKINDNLQKVLRHGQWAGTVQPHRKNGDTFWADSRVSLFRGEQGEPDGFIIIDRDISERIELEQQIRQLERMEAIGSITGTIAHDFNNMLMAISGYTQLAQTQIQDNHPVESNLKGIREACDKSAKLVNQLLSFSRKQNLKMQEVYLNELISNIFSMLEKIVPANIIISTDFDKPAYPVLSDPNHIEQALVNLVINARDAMPNGGEIIIRTTNITIDEAFQKGIYTIQPGSYVTLSVQDNGTGIDPEIQERIFEPFYTTKPAGKGTGLGLSSVYGMVKQSSGHIDIESQPGMGTTFHLYLPRAR